MKTKRQAAILELIESTEIYTQEEITTALEAGGISVAQATISRDIRELGLVRVRTRKGLRYVAPNGEALPQSPLEQILQNGLISAESAGNMLVLKTLSGMAMAVATAIDEMRPADILGTVAGDDTVICVVRSNSAAAALAESFL
jgi:transcriptional regulator of arginine metabolism